MDNPLYRLYMSFLVGASSINLGIVHCHVWLPEGRRVSKNLEHYSWCEEREEDGPWSYWTCGESQAKHVSEFPPPGGFLCHGGSNKSSKSWMTVSVLKSMVTWGSLILRNAQMKSGDVLEQFPTPSTQASVARVGHQPGWKGNHHGSWWEHGTCCIPRAFPGCKQTLAGKSPINGGFLLENHLVDFPCVHLRCSFLMGFDGWHQVQAAPMESPIRITIFHDINFNTEN